MMGTNRIRYRFEHRALRDFYFEDPAHFAEVLLYKPDSLYWLMDGFYKRNGEKIPYRPEQVSAGLVKRSDGVCALKISLPYPEEAALCYRIYAFLDEKDHKSGYFCIERFLHGDEDHVYVGQWHTFGQTTVHLGYGGRPSTQEEEFAVCVDYYKTFDPEKLVRLTEEREKGRQELKAAGGM